MNLFYSTDVYDTECTLGEEESKHAIGVLRLSAGDEIHVTDGKGSLYDCIISSTDNRICNVEILRKLPERNRRFSKVHIAIAPTKNNTRFEWFLEKSCEIGIDAITPIICEHSERRNLQEDRLNRILLGAMKQSQTLYLPVLNPIISVEEFMSSAELNTGNAFIAYYHENNRDLSAVCASGEDALVLIGPEGDFSESEREKANSVGIVAVNLGHTRLRTETAAIVAVHTISLLNNHTLKQ